MEDGTVEGEDDMEAWDGEELIHVFIGVRRSALLGIGEVSCAKLLENTGLF